MVLAAAAHQRQQKNRIKHAPLIGPMAHLHMYLLSCRGAPLPSIAQWISGLFGSVDLAPSDITAAMVLAAAAQRRRRKNRIKKALNPVIKAASNAATSTTTDDVSDIETESVDESKLCIADTQRCAKVCNANLL